MENWSATFTLLGTLLGYGISYFTSQSEKNWKKAKADISVLTDQLQSFTKLEELYSIKLAALDENGNAPITIKKKMRDEVEALPGFSRPNLKPSRLKLISNEWSIY